MMPKKYRMAVDYSRLTNGKGRVNYIQVAKNEGFDDICECADPPESFRERPWQIRPGTGRVGQRECIGCRSLIWPLAFVFECDECTEPALADHYPIPVEEPFLCDECI